MPSRQLNCSILGFGYFTHGTEECSSESTEIGIQTAAGPVMVDAFPHCCLTSVMSPEETKEFTVKLNEFAQRDPQMLIRRDLGEINFEGGARLFEEIVFFFKTAMHADW